MEFNWDEKKSEFNFKKHGIRFEEAQTIFLDPKSVEFYDIDHSDSEDRFIRLGCSRKGSLLLVIFCERLKDFIRIISARRATELERKIYEKRI